MTIYLAFFQCRSDGDEDIVYASPFSTYQGARAQADAWNLHYRDLGFDFRYAAVNPCELDTIDFMETEE